MNNKIKTYGLVLCGGQSLRMKRDKALIHYHGIPQYKWASELLAPFCDKVYCSVSKENANSIESRNILDKYPKQGPLGGMVSAFEFDNSVNWLILSCDMPYLANEDVLTLLKKTDQLSCYKVDDYINPLFSFWPKDSLAEVVDFFEKGVRSPRQVFTELKGDVLIPKDAQRHVNINKEG
jgi:molybdopterin-guanine dinucleotide biosynthesis protein A